MACKVAPTTKMTRIHEGYCGEVQDNLPQGYGVCTYRNSFFTYEGQWEKGVKQGYGKLKLKDGSYYEGQFMKGEIDGRGQRYWSRTRDLYDGELVKGEMCGAGCMKYGNGSSYTGDWVDNKYHGEGVLQKSDGATYSGSFYYHKRHGDGEQNYSDGGVYRGGWIGGMRHGHGIMSFPDNSVYEGQWRCDHMHGEGRLNHSSLMSYEGLWNNDTPLEAPCGIVVVGEEEVVLEYTEMPFSLSVECRTADGELTPECGRCLSVRASVCLADKGLEKGGGAVRSTPSKSSLPPRTDTSPQKDIRDEAGTNSSTDESTNRCETSASALNKTTTPFGYDVEAYPLCTKIVSSDRSDDTTTEDNQSTSTTPASVETVKLPTPTQLSLPNTPVKSFRDAVRAVNDSILDPPTFEYVPVETQRTVGGKASFVNLVLPVISSDVPATTTSACAPESPDTPEIKPSNIKKKEKEETGSGNRRRKGRGKVQQQPAEEKSEENAPEVVYKPGEYVIIVEDVTENPLMDIRLEPVYIHVKLPVLVKKTKSRGGNK